MPAQALSYVGVGLPSAPSPRVPWWAWVVPGLVCVLFLTLFWPRPYAIPRSDALTYYDAARHLAAEGRYYSDIWERPATPVTAHPPLFSMLWAAAMATGLPVVSALYGLQAGFLFLMGAAGGALSYRSTRSATGPLIWTVLSCGWPGGANWLYWIRPMTEAGNACCLVVVAWAATIACTAGARRAIPWLLLACGVAGLSMTLKGTGLFTFPVLGVVSLVVWRRHGGARAVWIPLAGAALMALPYSVWMVRNLVLIGRAESDKFTHPPAFALFLIREPSTAIIHWLLPSQLAAHWADRLPPLLVMGSFVLVILLLCLQAWRRRCLAALLPGTLAGCSVVAMGGLMLFIYTHEQRYWSTLIPCLAAAVLGVRAPRHPLLRLLFRMAVTAGLLYCWARFTTSRRTLWFTTPAGFVAQQALLAAALWLALRRIHHDLRCLLCSHSRRWWAQGLAAALCGATALAYWRFANEPRPLWTLAPLLGLGVVLWVPFGRRGWACGLRGLAATAVFALTWFQGQWSRDEVPRRASLTYDHHGVALEVRPDELRARQRVLAGSWPRLYSSNCHERFADLFGDHALIRPPNYLRLDRAAQGLPQLPEHELQVRRRWLADLRQRGIKEPFVMIYLTRVPQRNWSYGPEALADLDGLKVTMIERTKDYQIAICELTDPVAQSTPRPGP